MQPLHSPAILAEHFTSAGDFTRYFPRWGRNPVLDVGETSRRGCLTSLRRLGRFPRWPIGVKQGDCFLFRESFDGLEPSNLWATVPQY